MGYRIDDVTAIRSLPEPNQDNIGPPGFFTDGNPATGQDATFIPAWWLNMIQEEIVGTITGAGLSPDKTNNSQLLAAIKKIASVLTRLSPFSASYAESNNGYPAGAVISHPSIAGRFLICLSDGNSNDPAVNTTGWLDPLADLATQDALIAEASRAEQAEAGLAGNLASLQESLATNIAGVPIGVPIPWPSATIPSNAQGMVGQSFSVTQYPTLAAMYPSGIIPDMRGLVVRGYDTAGVHDIDGPNRALLSFQDGSFLIGVYGNRAGGCVDWQGDTSSATPVSTALQSYGWDNSENPTGPISNWTSTGSPQQAQQSWNNGVFYGAARMKNRSFNYIVRVS